MIHIICFGNVWQGDDGFGIHVCRRLGDMRCLLPQVKVFDAGIAGLNAIDYFAHCRKAVLVDAINTGGRIGSLHRFTWSDFDLPDPEFSLHSMGVHHLLTALSVVFEERALPEIVMIGVEIRDIHAFTDHLTPLVEGALDRAIHWIQRECMNSVS